jgi:hypothetical protein
VGGPSVEVPRCASDEGDYVLPSGDVDTCFVLVTNPGAMSEQCVEDGWNLEIDLIWRPGIAPTANTTVRATCQLSEDPALDCPNLGG